MQEIAASMGKQAPEFLPEALTQLQELKWTGNVRELRNMVERLAILCDKAVTASDIGKYAN
jgi:DNA-binding NtrC family response regulator